MLVNSFFHFINNLLLIFDLLIKLLILLFVLAQKVFLAIFEFCRNLLFSTTTIFQSFFQKLNFLVKQCFLLIKFRFRCYLLSLDLFLLGFSIAHFVGKFIDLALILSLLLNQFLIQLTFQKIFLTL